MKTDWDWKVKHLAEWHGSEYGVVTAAGNGVSFRDNKNAPALGWLMAAQLSYTSGQAVVAYANCITVTLLRNTDGTLHVKYSRLSHLPSLRTLSPSVFLSDPIISNITCGFWSSAFSSISSTELYLTWHLTWKPNSTSNLMEFRQNLFFWHTLPFQ